MRYDLPEEHQVIKLFDSDELNDELMEALEEERRYEIEQYSLITVVLCLFMAVLGAAICCFCFEMGMRFGAGLI